MTTAEQLETLLNLVQLAGGAENMTDEDLQFLQEEGTRLLKQMMDE